MDEPRPGTITQLLLDASHGDARAREELLPLVNAELRRVAAEFMNRDHAVQALQPTALVHEAYVRLVDQERVDWTNRIQFVGVAAVMMRRILVDHARDRIAATRGGAQQISLRVVVDAFPEPELDIIWLHDALDRLGGLDSRKARLVELRVFGGLTTTEIGKVLEMSSAGVEREWTFARAWLYAALCGERPAQG